MSRCRLQQWGRKKGKSTVMAEPPSRVEIKSSMQTAESQESEKCPHGASLPVLVEVRKKTIMNGGRGRREKVFLSFVSNELFN